MTQSLYFSDNFFSAGLTDIFDENKQKVGSLDLKSAFSSSVDVLDADEKVLMKGSFPFFSRRWTVTNHQDREIGSLKQRFSFFTKRYEYEAHNRGIYRIESEAFSKEYTVLDDSDVVVAKFEKVSGFFESPMYRLSNHSENLQNQELVAVVMGVNMIIKRNRSNAANSGAH